MDSFLRKRVAEGVMRRYGPKSDRGLMERAKKQVAHELDLIARLGFEGYFLIVWDIVQFCKAHDILMQGRGSAANSAVCYALEITAIDPVGMELLFERFLSESRGEWPDIDLDLPSEEKREQAIQYVYQRYGELGAAMTANVITYRGKSAAREVGKALGFDAESLGRLSGLVSQWEWRGKTDTMAHSFQHAGFDLKHPRIAKYLELCMRMQDLPRHLGQHSGGMVICQGQLNCVVPLERASMPGRTVVQWDKEDCADLGIIKVDLLGLGMMAVLKDCIELIPQHYGERVDLAQLPEDDEVYQGAAEGGYGGDVSGGEPGADGVAAAELSDEVLRPGGAGGDYPAGADCGEDDASVHAAAAGEGGGELSASFAGAGAEADAGRAAVSGAAAADCDDGGEFFRRGGGGVAAGGGDAAVVGADEESGGEAAGGDDGEWDRCEGAGRRLWRTSARLRCMDFRSRMRLALR